MFLYIAPCIFFYSQILYSLEENFRKAMDTLDELAEDFIVEGKDIQPNVVNQNIAYSTGEEHWGHWTTVYTKLNGLFSLYYVKLHLINRKNGTFAGGTVASIHFN